MGKKIRAVRKAGQSPYKLHRVYKLCRAGFYTTNTYVGQVIWNVPTALPGCLID